MVNDTGESLSRRISDDDLSWAGLNDWQIAYLSQATDDQREVVYREAIRICMGDTDAMPGLGI